MIIAGRSRPRGIGHHTCAEAGRRSLDSSPRLMSVRKGAGSRLCGRRGSRSWTSRQERFWREIPWKMQLSQCWCSIFRPWCSPILKSCLGRSTGQMAPAALATRPASNCQTGMDEVPIWTRLLKPKSRRQDFLVAQPG